MLDLIGIIAIIVFTIFGFKTAGEYGRSKLWALAVFLVGCVVKFVIPFAVSVGIVIVMLAAGKTIDDVETDMFGLGIVIGIIGTVGSVAAMMIVLKRIAQFPEDEDDFEGSGPPAPTEFDLK